MNRAQFTVPRIRFRILGVSAQVNPFLPMAKKNSCSRAASLVMSCLLLALECTSSVAMAQQSPDINPPVIELEELSESRAEQSQVFTAQVADDRVLKDVILYHRRSGQSAYTAAPMKLLGNTGYFSVAIKTDPADLRTIEYYMQARDDGGNRTVNGFAFDPFQRTLKAVDKPIRQSSVASEDTATTVESATRDAPATGKNRWWKIALGVVVVGALASLAQSNGNEDEGVPLDINLERPEL